MSFEIYNKLKGLSSWLFILAIINLFIISLIPWISITENNTKNELYFDSTMMERSENAQIKSIANYLSYIIDLLWFVIISSSISCLIFSVYLSEKFPRFSKIMINISHISLIINILMVYLQINLLKKITQMDNIYLASAFSFIKFAYIPLIIGFLLLIFSIIKSLYVILNFIKEKKFFKIGEKKIDEKHLISMPKKIVEKKPFSEKNILDFKLDIKPIEKGDWLKTEKEQKRSLEIESKSELLETEDYIINKKIFENEIEEEEKFIKSQDKINLEPFPAEKLKERSKESSEIPLSQQFEKALTSAVEKKHIEIKKQVPSETITGSKQEKYKETTEQTEIQNENKENLFSDEKKELIKKINVRCPQCKFVFTFEKKESITSIKCPNCGKEGVIKYLNEALKYPPLS